MMTDESAVLVSSRARGHPINLTGEGENGNELSQTEEFGTTAYGAIEASASGGDGLSFRRIRRSLKLIYIPFQVIGWLPYSSHQGEDQAKGNYWQCLDEPKWQKCGTCVRIVHVVSMLCIIAGVSTLQILMCLRRDTINIVRSGPFT
jgi:hypothetical protein